MWSHIRHYLQALLLLFLVAIGGKAAFALYHVSAWTGLGGPDIITALLWGWRFDLAVASILALLAYLLAYLMFRLTGGSFAAALRWPVTVAALVLLLLLGGDAAYFAEAGRHLGYELQETINSAPYLLAHATSAYPRLLALTGIAALALVVLLGWWLRPEPTEERARFPGPELALVVVIALGVLGTRGGIQPVPLEPLHVQTIGDSRQAAIALNGAYNALFSSITPYSIAPVIEGPASDRDRATVADLYPGPPTRATGPARPLNVVMVFLESWSAAYMGSYGYQRDTTPNFDRLRAAGLSSAGMLAGGRRTTEGLFATLCSAQNPLGQSIAQSQLQNYDYRCLPHRLAERGYSSAFFQGTRENTSGTGAFAQLLGFGESYGREDMPAPRLEPNSWGLHDPDLYAFALERMRALEQPFLVGINTNSTHDLHLPPQTKPLTAGATKRDHYLNVLHFADAALGDFVERVRREPFGEDTVFVILSDHAGLGAGSNFRNYAIPFVVYAPGTVAPRRAEYIASQRDAAPTLERILGLPPNPAYAGKALQASPPPHFADYFQTGTLGWVEGETLAEIPVGAPRRARCYDYRADPLLQAPEPCGDAALVARALAFTRVQQQLLFEGRLAAFADLRQATARGVSQPGQETALISGTGIDPTQEHN